MGCLVGLLSALTGLLGFVYVVLYLDWFAFLLSYWWIMVPFILLALVAKKLALGLRKVWN